MRPRAERLDAILAAALDPEGGEALSALGGAPLAVLPVDSAPELREVAPGLRSGAPILVGVDAAGAMPDDVADRFDVVLTTAARPPRPWVAVPEGIDAALSSLEATVTRCPVAAAVYATVLRLGDALDFEGALTVESLAYSTLLGGAEFRAWRSARPARDRPAQADAPWVRLERNDDRLTILLARPAARNAIGARVRDELSEALRLVRLDPSVLRVELRGEGPIFSAGGDLDEFGQAGDLALAHVIRSLRSPARLARELGPRLSVFVQGAAIGGGIEIAAAAGHVVAEPGVVFRLPEVGMGLIPGAGGTASVPRRIGRHRACFMGLSGLDVSADLALDWGLIDQVEPVA